MDKRFEVYEDLKADGRSEQRLIVFYGPVIAPTGDEDDLDVRSIAAAQYGHNPEVAETVLFADYRGCFTRPIQEELARRLHPKMYAYLDSCEGYSTIVLLAKGHKAGERLAFPDLPTVYCQAPWTQQETGVHHATLLGSIATIEGVKRLALEHSTSYTIDTDILPAVPSNFRGAAVWGNVGREVKSFLLPKEGSGGETQ